MLKKIIIVFFAALSFVSGNARAQRIKSSNFSFFSESQQDQYNQQLPQKSFAVNSTDFVILSRKAKDAYALERYGKNMKPQWSTPIGLASQETVEAFTKQGQTALVITHRIHLEPGTQALYAIIIDLATGKELQKQKLMEAPSTARKLVVSLSKDGSKLVTQQYLQKGDQLQGIQAIVYDGTLTKLKERRYEFPVHTGSLTAQVQIDNHGSQYLTLLTENSMRLSVRRYNNKDNEIKVMEVMLGGAFNNEKVYVLDTRFQLEQDSTLYAAALVAEEKTGAYRSLKLVRFDYRTNNMRFAEEFMFTPAFLERVSKANNLSTTAQLEDIYLSDILVSKDGQLVVMTEKKFLEAGPEGKYRAQDLMLFGYSEYLQPTWNSMIKKDQQAPAAEGFSGISYRSQLFGNRLQLLTLETLNGKTDLYTRSIHLLTGVSDAPKATGLKLAYDQQVAFAKDFTTWLDERSITAVNRTSKSSKGLRLSRITYKL
ncbi:hypothetical protein TH61_04385 [Rufibacter sp. DG15C]|uniref:hypothetical protein n=1 Tax=Rufibacter sp. DG15C TaxID=1379909 RepID=UPI00078C4A94|nr:hypothetical protein [Rufibacter sp. DG15C]AMM50567.1 hypothetical protein TH61_04385 [Rufibacter sp. DG15C]